MTWLPFDLHPEYPPEGIERRELDERYGISTEAQQGALFARNGLRYTASPRIPNSRDALRLTELARDHGLHDVVHDRLMEAFWGEGRDLGDHAVLREEALAAGLAADDVDRVLADPEELLPRVLASTQQAAQIGVTGVPAFLLDSKLLVLGAQPREVFEQALEQLGALAADG